jgi:hypothetical protein
MIGAAKSGGRQTDTNEQMGALWKLQKTEFMRRNTTLASMFSEDVIFLKICKDL